MIGLLLAIVGLMLLAVGLILASRTESKIIADLGEFIGICGCLVLIGMVAFYGISLTMRRI